MVQSSKEAASGGDADPRDRLIGQRIRTRRKARGLTLEQVAAAAEISVGQLSQIERGLTSPAVKDLREICRAIAMPVAWLFDDDARGREAEAGIIVRRSQRKALELSAATSMRKELLTPHLDGKLQFLWIAIEPGGSSGADSYSHEGEETGLVLSGRMELVVEDHRFILDAGDSFWFESERPHRFANPGSEPCCVLWISTPPFY